MKYAAFLSYARVDDTYSGKAITKFKTLLQSKLRELSGKDDIIIFRDEENIRPGANWKKTLDNAIQAETPIFIAAITPSYLNSEACRDELKKFLARENTLERKDLILPIYLVTADEIEEKVPVNWMTRVLQQRQRVDFRKYYAQRFKSKIAQEQIGKMAIVIKTVVAKLLKQTPIAEQPAQPLKLTRALRYSKDILDGESTVYKARIDHFKDEKLFLAERFGNYLLARLTRLCNDDHHVVLLIDAGTTLFPFFSKLGEYAVKARECVSGASSWIDNLTVVTNNLTGVHWLMKHGRLSPKNSWSEIALRCVLLSGIPLPAYSAITGSTEVSQSFLSCLMPEKSLAQLQRSKNRRRRNERPRVIALVTGNWIRIRQTSPRYPIPLARGRGHLSIKQSMIDLADEVYVITPLGKIFANYEKRETEIFLNKLVEAQNTPQYREVIAEESPYRILNEEDSTSQKIKLVTTYRPRGYLLSGLSALLGDQAYLSVSRIREATYAKGKDPFAYEAGSNLMFLFDGVSKKPKAQMEEEFPHVNTRNREFLEKFHVSDKFLTSLFS